jgi:hypothetical protein
MRTATYQHPDGRAYRLEQDAGGGPVRWFITQPGQAERQLEYHELGAGITPNTLDWVTATTLAAYITE